MAVGGDDSKCRMMEGSFNGGYAKDKRKETMSVSRLKGLRQRDCEAISVQPKTYQISLNALCGGKGRESI
jgi:hypothetical protein